MPQANIRLMRLCIFVTELSDLRYLVEILSLGDMQRPIPTSVSARGTARDGTIGTRDYPGADRERGRMASNRYVSAVAEFIYHQTAVTNAQVGAVRQNDCTMSCFSRCITILDYDSAYWALYL